ncbi:MAG: four helix bundle protein [Gemmatimonadaceae bacterium]
MRTLRFMHDFRRLEVWRRARDLVVTVESAIRGFPRTDRGLIAAQLRRAVLSIPANIAEGCGRNSRGETIRFLRIAAGSAAEAECHLEVATAMRYLQAAQHEALIRELTAIQCMLFRLIQNLP